jgi:hypothetical protein
VPPHECDELQPRGIGPPSQPRLDTRGAAPAKREFDTGRGLYDEPNAYFDQSVGAAHTRAANSVVIFDKPSFGEFQGEAGASPLYPPSGQDALHPDISQTWRFPEAPRRSRPGWRSEPLPN